MMKLGKRTKVFPLPSMQIELFNHFVPQVKTAMADHLGSVKVELKFVEHMPQVDGMRYNLSIEITEPIVAADLIDIAKCVDKYCVNEDEPYKASDGRSYVLGDGDDPYAVMFNNGEFSIWVRGWYPSEIVIAE